LDTWVPLTTWTMRGLRLGYSFDREVLLCILPSLGQCTFLDDGAFCFVREYERVIGSSLYAIGGYG
jgi:hypothetical protein